MFINLDFISISSVIFVLIFTIIMYKKITLKYKSNIPVPDVRIYGGSIGVGKSYIIEKHAKQLREIGVKVYVWRERVYLFNLQQFYDQIPGSAFTLQSISWNDKQQIAENIMEIFKNEPTAVHLIERGIQDCCKVFGETLYTTKWPEKKFVCDNENDLESGKWILTGKEVLAISTAEKLILTKNFINAYKNSPIWGNCTYIFVNTSSKKSKQRITNRGRESEQNISEDYLDVLINKYNKLKIWLEGFKSVKIITLDNNQDY